MLQRSLYLLLATSVFLSCKDHKNSQGGVYDPSKPISITGFAPDSGGVRTKFIIQGSNFGSSPKDIEVFFEQKDSEGNVTTSEKAVVINTVGDVLYCLVPKLPNGMQSLRVKHGESEAVYGNNDNEKEFKYIVAKSVSTVVGKAKSGQNKNGTLAEAEFGQPRYCMIDNNGNLLVSDAYYHTLRYVNLKGNVVKTLFTGDLLGQGVADDKRENFFVLSDGQRILYRFSPETNWAAENRGAVVTGNLFMHSVTFGPEADKKWFYSRYNTGAFVRFPNFQGRDVLNPGRVQILGHIGLDQGGQNGHLVYNPHDGYFYCAVHRNNALFRIKLTPKEDPDELPTVEIKLISKSEPGYKDGEVDFTGEGNTEVAFREPRGVALDSKGNVYIADFANHCIRMLNIKTGVVSTVAGVPGKAGYKDGDPEEALFNHPFGIAIDQDDFLYIGDQDNHCVRKLAIE